MIAALTDVKRSIVVALVVAASVGGAACGSGASASGAAASKPSGSPAASAPAGAADRIRVRTEKPSRDVIASYMETTSHVEAIAEADVFARASSLDKSGVIREIRVEEGERVKAGDVLAVLDQAEARISVEQAHLAFKESERNVADSKLALEESEGRLSLTKGDAEQAKRDYDRDVKLSQSEDSGGLRVLAPRAVEASKLLWERAENAHKMSVFASRRAELALVAAEQARDRAQLEWNLSKTRFTDTEIKAPISGVVSMRGVKVGETASPSTRLFRITDLDRLQTTFHRPQRDLRLLGQGGQEVSATSEAVVTDVANGEPHVFTGRIERVSPVVDPLNGTFKVTASLRNPDALLRPGLLVRVRVTLGRRENAYLVPKRARVLDGEKPYVFVVRGGRTVRVPIDEGFADADRIEVRNVGAESALHADDEVVIVANVDLREGLAVTSESAPNGAPAGTTAGG